MAYHDRSDGGLLTTLCDEMAFAGHCGLELDFDSLSVDIFASLFNDELGAVIEVQSSDFVEVQKYFRQHTDLITHLHVLGKTNNNDKLNFYQNDELVFSFKRSSLQRAWSETSYQMQGLRDNPDCALQELMGN